MNTFDIKILRLIFGILIIGIDIKKVSSSIVFECLESGFPWECRIAANLTKDDPRFIIDNSRSYITEFKFVKPSNVPVLTSDVCDSIPNLHIFNAANVSIEEIHSNAFKNCLNLTEIDLMHNPIKILPEDTFAGLGKLRSLYLKYADLPEISEGLFHDLKVLKLLSLSSSKIVSLPAKVFEGLVNLKTLIIYSNELMDFDVEEALTFLTNLEKMYPADNNFRCDRLKEMLAAFAKSNVTVKSGFFDERTRNYQVQTIQGIHCLDDEQWTLEIRKKSLDFPHFFKHVPREIELIEAMDTIQMNKEAISEVNQQLAEVDALYEIRKHNFTEKITKLQRSLNERLVANHNYVKQVNASIYDSITKIKQQQQQKFEKLSQDQTNGIQQTKLAVEKVSKDAESLENAFNKKLANVAAITNQKFEKLSQDQIASFQQVSEAIKKISNDAKAQKNFFNEKINDVAEITDQKFAKLSQDQTKGFQQASDANERVNNNVEALRKTLNEKIVVIEEIMKNVEKLSQDQISGFQQMNQENERVSKDVEALRNALNNKITDLDQKFEKLSQNQVTGFQQASDANERVNNNVEALRKALNEKVIVETIVTNAEPTGTKNFVKNLKSVLGISIKRER